VLSPDPALKFAVCLDGPTPALVTPSASLRVTEIADPSGEDHDHMLEWCGGAFDPHAFSPESVNRIFVSIKV
jgi:hypothetical protein